MDIRKLALLQCKLIPKALQARIARLPPCKTLEKSQRPLLPVFWSWLTRLKQQIKSEGRLLQPEEMKKPSKKPRKFAQKLVKYKMEIYSRRCQKGSPMVISWTKALLTTVECSILALSQTMKTLKQSYLNQCRKPKSKEVKISAKKLQPQMPGLASSVPASRRMQRQKKIIRETWSLSLWESLRFFQSHSAGDHLLKILVTTIAKTWTWQLMNLLTSQSDQKRWGSKASVNTSTLSMTPKWQQKRTLKMARSVIRRAISRATHRRISQTQI